MRLARNPSHRLPSGWVPMQADRIPMTRPCARSGAVRRTMALCIVAKPESVAPMASWSASDRPYQGDSEKARSRSAPASELAAKSRP